METTRIDIAVTVYDRQAEADAAVKALQHARFDMTNLSIICRDYEPHDRVVGYLRIRAPNFGRRSVFVHFLRGVVTGSARTFVPVIGHVIVLGPMASVLFDGLHGMAPTGSGIPHLPANLMALGIPRAAVRCYEKALKADRLLLIVHGEPAEILRARDVLQLSDAATFDHHKVGLPPIFGPIAGTLVPTARADRDLRARGAARGLQPMMPAPVAAGAQALGNLAAPDATGTPPAAGSRDSCPPSSRSTSGRRQG